MRLRINDPLAQLEKWYKEKYNEIDEEYNFKVKELKTKISKYDEQISQIISNVQELLNEGDVSVDQVKQIQSKIEVLTSQINDITMDGSMKTMNELNLLGSHIRLGRLQYHVKAKIQCHNTDLYALECEKSLAGYNGLCPKCKTPHVILAQNRGFYALCEALHSNAHHVY